MKFRKKPVVVDVFQMTPDTYYPEAFRTWPEWLTHAWMNVAPDTAGAVFWGVTPEERNVLFIRTLEGIMSVTMNDWIIKGVQGELYPCKPDIFAATYEPVSEQQPEDGREVE